MPHISFPPAKDALFNASRKCASRVKLPQRIGGGLPRDFAEFNSSTKLIKLFKSWFRDNPKCHFSEEAKENFVRFLKIDGQDAEKEKLMVKLRKMAKCSKKPLNITEFREGYDRYDHFFEIESYRPRLTINGKTYEAYSGPNPQNFDIIKCFNKLLDQANIDINHPVIRLMKQAIVF